MRNTYTNIQVRIIIIFICAMFYSFIPEFVREFFDDTHCKTGSGLWIYGSNVAGHFQYCNYSNHSHEAGHWHWGYRHWLFMSMGICLSVVQIISLIVYVDKKS